MVFCILLIILAIRIIVLVPTVKLTLSHLDAALVSVQAIETNTTRTEAELAGLLNQTRHIAEDEHKAQQQQLADVHSLTVRAGKLLDDADVSVQQLGDSAKSLDAVGPAVVNSLQTTTQQLQDTLGMGQNMLKAATLDLLDPNIQKSMDNLASATDGAKVATQQAAATMTSVHSAVDYEIAELEKPVKKVKVAVLFIATLAGKFFGY
jgi:hypothetical protein